MPWGTFGEEEPSWCPTGTWGVLESEVPITQGLEVDTTYNLGAGGAGVLLFTFLFPQALPWLLGRELGWDPQVPTTPWTWRSRTDQAPPSCRAVAARGPTLVGEKVCSQEGRRLNYLTAQPAVSIKVREDRRQCSSPAAPAPAHSISLCWDGGLKAVGWLLVIPGWKACL